jgi:hypothetical protein
MNECRNIAQLVQNTGWEMHRGTEEKREISEISIKRVVKMYKN